MLKLKQTNPKIHKHFDDGLTNTKPPLRTPHQTGSDRKPRGMNRCHGPAGTTPFHRTSHPSFPSPSNPIHSARIYGQKINSMCSLRPAFPPCLTHKQTVHAARTKMRTEGTSYSACMLALVSSKAHSTDSGLREVTLLHSICRFSLKRGTTVSSGKSALQTGAFH